MDNNLENIAVLFLTNAQSSIFNPAVSLETRTSMVKGLALVIEQLLITMRHAEKLETRAISLEAALTLGKIQELLDMSYRELLDRNTK